MSSRAVWCAAETRGSRRGVVWLHWWGALRIAAPPRNVMRRSQGGWHVLQRAPCCHTIQRCSPAAPAAQQVSQDGVALGRNLAGLGQAVGQLASVQSRRRPNIGRHGAGRRRRRQRRRASRRLRPPAPPHSLARTASDTALRSGRAVGGLAAWFGLTRGAACATAVDGLRVCHRRGCCDKLWQVVGCGSSTGQVAWRPPTLAGLPMRASG